jgi:hypothetical protein
MSEKDLTACAQTLELKVLAEGNRIIEAHRLGALGLHVSTLSGG